jgi:predicted ester cyclase
MPDSSMLADQDAVERLARANLDIVASGDLDRIDENVGTEFWDMQGGDTPTSTREHGPDAFATTVRWLHTAFTDVRFEIHDIFIDGDRAAVYVTMHARQHGPFVVPNPDGTAMSFASNGHDCHVRAVHMYRVAGGRVVAHDAVRDDMSMARQLGWIPSGPPGAGT